MDEYEARDRIKEIDDDLGNIEDACGEIIDNLGNGLLINGNTMFKEDLDGIKQKIHDKRYYEMDDIICALPN